MQQQLKEKGLLNERKTAKRKEEKLTDRELKELMGIYAPTYGRKKGGAIRQTRRG